MDTIEIPRILVQTSNNEYRIIPEDEVVCTSVDAKEGEGSG